MMLTRALWLLVGLNIVLFVFAIWAARQEDKVVDEVERLRDKLDQLWGESEAHASGDTCLNCNRLATAEGFPWCDQCFLEEQGKYLAAESEMWKAKAERLQAEAGGPRRWLAAMRLKTHRLELSEGLERQAVRELQQQLAESETDLTETNAENARLADEYQSAAGEVCAALDVEWTPENRYPTVAVEAIERLQVRSGLVTLELAVLLERLALGLEMSCWCNHDKDNIEAAYATATRIHKLTEEANDAN